MLFQVAGWVSTVDVRDGVVVNNRAQHGREGDNPAENSFETLL